MLDVGVLVETLETATYWSRLREVYDAVSAALRGSLGESAIVLCHVSHVYETGASLYFTVAAAEGDDPLGRWLAAKAAAMDAIVAAGATITHHHAVGTDHQPWLEAEIGAGRHRRAARRQGRRRPGGDPQPGRAGALTRDSRLSRGTSRPAAGSARRP